MAKFLEFDFHVLVEYPCVVFAGSVLLGICFLYVHEVLLVVLEDDGAAIFAEVYAHYSIRQQKPDIPIRSHSFPYIYHIATVSHLLPPLTAHLYFLNLTGFFYLTVLDYD